MTVSKQVLDVSEGIHTIMSRTNMDFLDAAKLAYHVIKNGRSPRLSGANRDYQKTVIKYAKAVVNQLNKRSAGAPGSRETQQNQLPPRYSNNPMEYSTTSVPGINDNAKNVPLREDSHYETVEECRQGLRQKGVGNSQIIEEYCQQFASEPTQDETRNAVLRLVSAGLSTAEAIAVLKKYRNGQLSYEECINSPELKNRDNAVRHMVCSTIAAPSGLPGDKKATRSASYLTTLDDWYSGKIPVGTHENRLRSARHKHGEGMSWLITHDPHGQVRGYFGYKNQNKRDRRSILSASNTENKPAYLQIQDAYNLYV